MDLAGAGLPELNQLLVQYADRATQPARKLTDAERTQFKKQQGIPASMRTADFDAKWERPEMPNQGYIDVSYEDGSSRRFWEESWPAKGGTKAASREQKVTALRALLERKNPLALAPWLVRYLRGRGHHVLFTPPCTFMCFPCVVK